MRKAGHGVETDDTVRAAAVGELDADAGDGGAGHQDQAPVGAVIVGDLGKDGFDVDAVGET